MSRSQSENTKKRRSPVVWLLLALLLLSLTVGGVSAYLSMSSQSATNSFTHGTRPTVTVDGSSVTVDAKEYGVYLRVAVDACWQSTTDASVILAGEPSGGYSINTAEWELIGGFYYYKHVITGTKTLTPVTITGTDAPDGYKLAVNLAAQIIQSVGRTDDGTQTAVENAWGVSSTAFIAE